jgi:hypothetical protein
MKIQEFIQRWFPEMIGCNQEEDFIRELKSISPWVKTEDELPIIPKGKVYVQLDIIRKSGKEDKYDYFKGDEIYFKSLSKYWAYKREKPE